MQNIPPNVSPVAPFSTTVEQVVCTIQCVVCTGYAADNDGSSGVALLLLVGRLVRFPSAVLKFHTNQFANGFIMYYHDSCLMCFKPSPSTTTNLCLSVFIWVHVCVFIRPQTARLK